MLQATMPCNVEIKAKVRDLESLRKLAANLSGSDGELLEQEDTFFKCANGRLKLRVRKGSLSELIFYDRPDKIGPKVSEFCTTEVQDPDKLKCMLEQALGVYGTVVKSRWLYLVGQTRVHLDHVHGLGDFLELEVMLKEAQTPQEGQKIASDLMEKLGVQEGDLLNCAYMDLILQQEIK